MSNNRNSCSKCSHQGECKCKRPKDICHEDGCADIIPSECVVYKPLGGTSALKCYIGAEVKTPVQEILETLDYKLCNAFTLQVDTCIADLLGINGIEVDYKVFLNKLSNHICNSSDKFVKISASDTQSGYLFDKIAVGPCMVKRIIRDSNNVERIEISLDFNCLQSELGTSSCIEVDCCGSGGTPPSNNNLRIATNTSTVCGSNVATLTAEDSCYSIFWFRDNTLIASGTETSITVNTTGNYYAVCRDISGNNMSISNNVKVTNTGECGCIDTVWVTTGRTRCISGVSQIEKRSNCMNYEWVTGGNHCSETCIPVWVDTVPSVVYCGHYLNEEYNTTAYDNCKLYAQFENQCNSDKQWLEYTGSPDPEFEGCCPPCSPDGTYECEVTGGTVSFFNSCGDPSGSITMNPLTQKCTVSSQAYIEIEETYGGGAVPGGYYVEYSLSGATTRPFQGSKVFNNLNNGTHTVTMKVTRIESGTTMCQAVRSITITQCEGCDSVWAEFAGSEFCKDGDRYIVEREYCEGVLTGNQRDKLVEENSEECEAPCTDPIPTISITSPYTLLCPGRTSVRMDAVSTGCTSSLINWYIIPDGETTPVWYGTGTYINYSGEASARFVVECSSCAGTKRSNEYQISYAGTCPSECDDPAGQIEIYRSTGGTICKNSQQSFTALAEHCSSIIWFVDNSQVGTGQFLTNYSLGTNSSYTIKAICENCNADVESNTITLTTEDCDTYYLLTRCGDTPGSACTTVAPSSGALDKQRVEDGSGNKYYYTTGDPLVGVCTGAITVTEVAGKTECIDPVYYRLYEVESCEDDQTYYVGDNLSSYPVGQRIILNDNLNTTYTGNYIDVTSNPSNYVSNSLIDSVVGCEDPVFVTYYAVDVCGSEDQVYVDTDLSGATIGDRIDLGGGDFGTYTGGSISVTTPPSSFVDNATDTGLTGCPETLVRYYLLQECETSDEYYTTEDLSSTASSTRVTINGTLTGTYTGSFSDLGTPPSNLASSVLIEATTGCPEPPEEFDYYVVLRCSDDSEGYVELDLSGATVGDRIDLGSGEFGTYTGDFITQATAPSPLWTGTLTVETGCPE